MVVGSITHNVLQLKEVADLTDKSMNGERNLIQAQNFIRGTKPAISFKVLLSAGGISTENVN